jgi:hypothetical protein
MEERFNEEKRRTARNIQKGITETGESFSKNAKDTIVHEFDRICSALHTATQTLNADHSYFAGIFDTVSNTADNASRYIRDHDPAELIDKVRDFSQRNPYVLTGGMFIAGLALSRFLKAGSPEVHGQKEERYEHGA